MYKQAHQMYLVTPITGGGIDIRNQECKIMMVFYYKREVQGSVLFFITSVTKSHISYLN